MIQAITITGIALAAILLIVFFGCFIFTVQYLWMYHCHKCPHCKHFMEFKGLKEDNENGHFLFHCPKCGAWEQVPKEEFLRRFDKC